MSQEITQHSGSTLFACCATGNRGTTHCCWDAWSQWRPSLLHFISRCPYPGVAVSAGTILASSFPSHFSVSWVCPQSCPRCLSCCISHTHVVRVVLSSFFSAPFPSFLTSFVCLQAPGIEIAPEVKWHRGQVLSVPSQSSA